VASTVQRRRSFLPVVAGLVGLVAGGLGVALATGHLQLGARDSALEVQRDTGVEGLFPGREAVFVYRFRGGLPKCWAHVERPSGPEDLFLDAKPAVVQGPTPRTPPDEVEGLVALVGPAEGEKGEYTLHLIVTRLGFPAGRRPLGAAFTATYWTGPKPNSPKPSTPAASPHPPVTDLQFPDLKPGQEVELVNGPPLARGPEGVRVRVSLRFYSTDELANAVPESGGAP
jgi:hypothetical protein